MRIRRRGGGEGAVFNSRSKSNRCFIPRLRLIGEEEVEELKQRDEQEEKEIREELQNIKELWAKNKSMKRVGAGNKNIMGSSQKRGGANYPRGGETS